MLSAPPAAPRLTARGVAVFAAAYVALAAFYSVTITWYHLGRGPDVFVAETLDLLPRSLLDYAIKAALTLPAWWIAVRRLDGRPGLQVAAHVVLGPAWVWAGYVVYRGLATALGYGLGYVASWDVFIPALVYAAQFGALHAVHFVAEVRRQSEEQRALLARQSELERTARDAQLAALRAQMDPHFLFNTLNSVAASVPAEQGATRDLVARLAGLVRYTLAAARRDRVLLREELDFVRDYLALEGERMGGRLRVRVEADADALDAMVPPMLVQPLVENAVRHGLAPTVDGGTVWVEARCEGGAVRVTVRDDGAGPPVPPPRLLGRRQSGGEAPAGVGLSNTDARLRALFGTGLVLDAPGAGDGAPRGFRARFEVPAA